MPKDAHSSYSLSLTTFRSSCQARLLSDKIQIARKGTEKQISEQKEEI
jgi:hypothetical protein